MPINHPYDPRYNAKIYIPKLTEEERRARATPLENLRGLGFRTATPAAPGALPSPPEIATAEIATPQDPTPEAPTVETPTAEVPTAEVPTPEPVAQEDPAPDYLPAAWEVVFAAFPELYPEHSERVCAAVAAPGVAHAPRSNAPWRTGLPPASSQRRAAHWVVLSACETSAQREHGLSSPCFSGDSVARCAGSKTRTPLWQRPDGNHSQPLSRRADAPIHAEPPPSTETDRQTRWTESRRRACRGAPCP